MNKEWSEANKSMQLKIGKKGTFDEGIAELFKLRGELMKCVDSFREKLRTEEFSAIPFINADGYHNKTVGYSLWHIFRIEDIVAHSLIADDEQVFFSGGYRERIKSPIITTGNELFKEEIAEFSRQLDISELYSYIHETAESTERILSSLQFEDTKRKITEEKKQYLMSLNVVSSDERAVWLIDYWCGKNIGGLIKMPFSRHWIMHIEACLRIIAKLK